MTSIAVDVAGASMGGARRFLDEFDNYLSQSFRQPPLVIGRGSSITPRHLLARELKSRGVRCKIAINNVSFVAGRRKIVLLRNALHFLGADEADELRHLLAPRVRVETQVVREMARRADLLVVPTHSMRERVIHHLPSAEGRIEVRLHPLSPPTSNSPAVGRTSGYILCPILDAPFKRLGALIAPLLEALETNDWAIGTNLVLTCTNEELAKMGLFAHDRVIGVGRVSHAEVGSLIRDATALVYPTKIESFGYPLAEARLAGKPVIGNDSTLSREVAGEFLMAYTSSGDVGLAVYRALTGKFVPELFNPFDPKAYFDWLLEQAQE
jgi:glycosyltransferase involved in cell wall biosynthesis